MIAKFLNDKKGEGYIDGVVVVLIAVLGIAFALNVYPVFVAKSNLNQFASEVIREAEISGQVGSSVNERIEKLEKELIKVDTIDWDADFIQGTKKVQLDGSIELEVTKTVDIGFFEFGSFPVTLVAKDSGFSERYWK